MTPNPVKATLAQGGSSIGTMIFEFNTPGIARIAANAGAEFVIYDMEHTGWSIETIRQLIATTPRDRIVPLVRPPASEYHLLSRPLDVGALGLMVPMVETAEQAHAIVQSTTYPPAGGRGSAFTLAHDDYTDGDIVTKMRAANAEILRIAQIETALGVENADAIAATPGIDVLWIGHFDLSASLGIPGQFTHPTYLRAVETVLAACHRHGKTPGIMAADVETAIARQRDGFRAIAYSGDLWIYARALRDDLASIRQNAT